jgi:hypothetical protein
MIRRYVNYMDRLHESRQGFRGLSLGGALFCAAMLGYVLGSDRFGPSKVGSLMLFAALLMGSLQDLVSPRWLRLVVLPAGFLVLWILAAVMFFRAHGL